MEKCLVVMEAAVAILVLCKIAESWPAKFAAVLGLDEKVEENGEVGAAIATLMATQTLKSWRSSDVAMTLNSSTDRHVYIYSDINRPPYLTRGGARSAGHFDFM